MPRKKDFDEDELLERAVNLFWEKGYYATSAQDLVDTLQINRSSLYNTYTDKRTLFIKSLKQYQHKQTSAVLKLLNNAEDVYTAIQQIFNAIVEESISTDIRKGCFMVNTSVELSSHDAEIKDLVNANNTSVVNALAEAIKKGRKAGQIIQEGDADALAQYIFNNINGLRVAARSGADEKTLRSIVEITLRSLR